MWGIYLLCGTIDSWGRLLALNSAMSGRCLLCWMRKCGGLFFLLDFSCWFRWTLPLGAWKYWTVLLLLANTAIKGTEFPSQAKRVSFRFTRTCVQLFFPSRGIKLTPFHPNHPLLDISRAKDKSGQ